MAIIKLTPEEIAAAPRNPDFVVKPQDPADFGIDSEPDSDWEVTQLNTVTTVRDALDRWNFESDPPTRPNRSLALQPRQQQQPQQQQPQQQQPQQQQPPPSPSSILEDLVMPDDPEVTVVKVLVDKMVREQKCDRPAPLRGESYEVDFVAAVGRDAWKRIVLLVKYKGYPWSEASWQVLKDVSPQVKRDLVRKWGALGRITAESTPLSVDVEDDDEDEGVAQRPTKKARHL